MKPLNQLKAYIFDILEKCHVGVGFSNFNSKFILE